MKSFKKFFAVTLAVIMVLSTFAVSFSVFAATKKVSVTKVSLSTSKSTVYTGKTLALTATVSPKNATKKTVKWTTSNKNVAAVSSKGVVTGKKAGSATITATATDGSGKKATCKITVKKFVKITGIKLNATQKTAYLGTTATLKATVSPSTASIKTLTWTSSNTKVAKVSAKGVITPVKAGTATITATATDGSKKSASCKVTVTALKVTKISLNNTKLSLETGKSATLKATVSPSNATNKSVTWSTSNKAVATVSSKGVVKAVKAGSAVITVKAADGSGKTATCKLTVTPKTYKVTAIKISSNTSVWYEGQVGVLTASVTPSNATNTSVTWSCSDTKIATVDSKGNVKAGSIYQVTKYKTGLFGIKTSYKEDVKSAVITATAKDGSGIAATYTINLTKSTAVSKVAFDTKASTRQWYAGQTGYLPAYASPLNATFRTLTYSSSDTSVAKITNEGYLTCLKAGTVVITAKEPNSGKSASVTLVIKKVDITASVKGITVASQSREYYYVGESAILSSTTSVGGETVSINGGVHFESSNSLIAEVIPTQSRKSARVTFKAPGTVKIYAVSNISGAKSEAVTVTVRGLGGKLIYENIKGGDKIAFDDIYVTDGTNKTGEVIYISYNIESNMENVLTDDGIQEQEGKYAIEFKDDIGEFSGYLTVVDNASLVQNIYFTSGEFTKAPSSTSKTELLSQMKTLSKQVASATNADVYKNVITKDLNVDTSKSSTTMTMKAGKLDITELVTNMMEEEDLSMDELSADGLIEGIFGDNNTNGIPSIYTLATETNRAPEITVDEKDVKSIEVTNENARYYTIKMTLNDVANVPVANMSTSAYGKSMAVIDKKFVDGFSTTDIQKNLVDDDSMKIDELTISKGSVSQSLSGGYVSYTVDKLTGKVASADYHYNTRLQDDDAKLHIKMTVKIDDTDGSLILKQIGNSISITIDISTSFLSTLESNYQYKNLQY